MYELLRKGQQGRMKKKCDCILILQSDFHKKATHLNQIRKNHFSQDWSILSYEELFILCVHILLSRNITMAWCFEMKSSKRYDISKKMANRAIQAHICYFFSTYDSYQASNLCPPLKTNSLLQQSPRSSHSP